MGVHKQVADLFNKYFEDVPFFPTFGNNDAKYHYQPAFSANEKRFYDELYKLWFKDHKGNQ